jgi:hypothetical protein
MRRLVAAALFVGAVAGGVGVPAAIGAAPACAATTGPHAGLVVVTDSGTNTFCVALDDTEVSGLELIELAHAQGGLSYRFGNGGLAVCQLEAVGPSGSDCFDDYPDFWGYWHGDGAGGWTWASTGAGSARIGDGEVDAWVWGSGDTAASHARPPALGIDDLCHAEPSPRPTPTSTHTSTPSPGAAAAPSAGSGPPGPSPTSSHSAQGTPSPSHSRTPSPSAVDVSDGLTTGGQVYAAAGTSDPPAAGPPVGLLVALCLGIALVGGGVLRLRSRSPQDPPP